MAKPSETTAASTPADEASTEPAPGDPNGDVARLPYEQARDELTSIVDRLETGQVGLEESMALWQRGEALAAHCARWLDQAQELVSSMDESELTD